MPLLQPPSPLAPRPGPRRPWAVLVAGGAGVLWLLLLAAAGWAELGPALAAAGLAAVVAGALFARAARQAEAAPPPAAPVLPAPSAPLTYPVLVEALPDPVLVVAAREPDDLTDRRVVFANRRARELFRIVRDEAMLVTVVRDPDVLEAIDEGLFGRTEAEAAFQLAGAQERSLRVIVKPLGAPEDDLRLAIAVVRDETEARRVERTRADFLANASHELRTPLASLLGFIETLRGPAREDEAARDRFLGIMQAQAERMSRLIGDLMSLGRIELNEHVPPQDVVDLAAAVADVADALKPLAEGREVRLQTSLPPPGAAAVVGDRDQIVQVAQNLIENAIKYSPAGAPVVIEVAADTSPDPSAASARPRLTLLAPDLGSARYAVVRVGDQGPGIAREHFARLTERFYRVEGQKSGARLGTGLGLAIVKHILNRHRGALVVESAPGEGATFSAYLPSVQAPGAQTNASSNPRL